MKRNVLFLFILLVLFSCRKNTGYYNEDGSLVTRDQAIELTEELWQMFDCAFISAEPLKPKTAIKQGAYHPDYYTPNYLAWMVVMYEVQSNALDKYRYVFVNAKTGVIFIEPEKRYFIFEDDGKWWGFRYPTDIPSRTVHNSAGNRSVQTTKSSSSSNNWAVIISGGATKENNYERYWNDCSEMFRILTQNYNYNKSHIYLLMSDGTSSGADMNLCYYNYYLNGQHITGPFVSSPTDYDGDGVTESNLYSATKSNLQSVFTSLGQQVADGDDVFIYVCDHGERIGNTSYIRLWNNELLSPSEFRTEGNKLHNDSGHTGIVMGQCYSGGFVGAMNKPNCSIATASAADEESNARDNLEYDAFLFWWMSSMKGYVVGDESPVDADIDDLTGISFYEAFSYAQMADNEDETPQYQSSPEYSGKINTLETPQLSAIQGPSNLSNNYSGTYYITGLPSSAGITWSGTNVSFSSPSLYSTTAGCFISSPFTSSTIHANVSAGINIDIYKDVTLWGVGNYTAPDLISGFEGVYSFSCPAGAYGFSWGCDNADWTPMYQGYCYVDFETDESGVEPSVWVTYYTPCGDLARVIRPGDE